MLTNSNDEVAVNISALPIEVLVPNQILDKQRETRAAWEGPTLPDPPTKWVIRFETIQRLTRGNRSNLPYRIDGLGVLQQENIGYVLRNSESMGQDGLVRCRLTITMENLAMKRWKLFYRLRYNPWSRPSQLHAEFLGVKEVYRLH